MNDFTDTIKKLTTTQWAMVAGVIVLGVAIFSPASVAPLYTTLNLAVSVASLAFYSLGALWFWRQLNKREPQDTAQSHDSGA